jgi:SPP1 family predicted phage head-tail adaptor
MALCAKDFRDYITVEKNTDSVDGHGGLTNSWSTRTSIWCMIKDTGGSDPSVSGRRETIKNVSVTTHYDSAIITEDRLVIDSIYYDINSIENIDRRGIHMIITATSEVL